MATLNFLEKVKKKISYMFNIFDLYHVFISVFICNFLTGHCCEYSVKLDKVDDEKTEYLSPEQFQDLWRAIESDSNEDAGNFMKMVIFTGMRKGELLKLQKSHIDWQTGFINIVDPKGK